MYFVLYYFFSVCRSLICYEDFCRSLEASGAQELAGSQDYGNFRRNRDQKDMGTRLHAVLGDGYDGLRRNNEDTLGSARSYGYNGRDRDLENERVNSSRDSRENTPRDRYSDTRNRNSYDQDYSYTNERGSLLPPKPSDSISRNRLGAKKMKY